MIEIDITVNKRSANDPAPRRKIFFTNGKEAFLIFAAKYKYKTLVFTFTLFIKKKIVQE